MGYSWNWQILFILTFLWGQFGYIFTANYKGCDAIESSLCPLRGKIDSVNS